MKLDSLQLVRIGFNSPLQLIRLDTMIRRLQRQDGAEMVDGTAANAYCRIHCLITTKLLVICLIQLWTSLFLGTNAFTFSCNVKATPLESRFLLRRTKDCGEDVKFVSQPLFTHALLPLKSIRERLSDVIHSLSCSL